MGKFLVRLWDDLGKLWAWLVLSSANPESTSLTLKATFTGFITYGTMLAGLGHVQLPVDQLTSIADMLIQFVQTVLLLVSIGVGIFGALRKLYFTFGTPPSNG